MSRQWENCMNELEYEILRVEGYRICRTLVYDPRPTLLLTMTDGSTINEEAWGDHSHGLNK